MTDAPLTTTLPLDGPLDLRRTLSPLRMGSWDPTLRLSEREAHWALRTPDGPVALALTVDDGLHAAAHGPGAGWAIARAAELSGAWDAAAPPDALCDLARRAPGLRLPRTHSVVDAMVRAILQQLITWLLPLAPRALLTLPRERYLAAGVLGRQADTIRRVASVAPRMEEAAALPLEDATRRMEAVPGVGPWTSASVALRALGHADAVPLRDVHIPHNVGWYLAREPQADDARMLELLAPFAPHRGRLIRYLQETGTAAPRRGPRSPIRRPR
jgi:3-methyladenine DNA glycosylase/8-oxoguanine DNA glycosylase